MEHALFDQNVEYLRDMFEELASSASFFLVLLFWTAIALIFIAGFIWVKTFKNLGSKD